jgi:hypothetical protein
VVYDPAWDMPLENYRQTGPFVLPQVPPGVAPDEGTTVCVSFAQEWLPYIQGALDALRNPSSWSVADDDAMFAVLSQANRLRQLFGQAGDCAVSYQERFTSDCVLEYSTDGGTTWSAVPGWVENFQNCVQSLAPIDGAPPNPGEITTEQMACSVATYLADEVIKLAMQKAIDALGSDTSLIQYAIDVMAFIPGFPIVGFGLDALLLGYNIYTGVNHSLFETALTDAALWSDVRCAIYTAIAADGYVTSANCAAVIANLCGISYSPSAVITGICSFVTALGCDGLKRLQQPAGLILTSDCTDCGSWCHEWGESTELFTDGWSLYGGFGEYHAGTNRWGSIDEGAGDGGQHCYIQLTLDPTRHYSRIHVNTTFTGTPTSMIRGYSGLVGGTPLFSIDTNDFVADITGVTTLLISGSQYGAFEFGSVFIEGPGTDNPFGANNCV